MHKVSSGIISDSHVSVTHKKSGWNLVVIKESTSNLLFTDLALVRHNEGTWEWSNTRLSTSVGCWMSLWSFLFSCTHLVPFPFFFWTPSQGYDLLLAGMGLNHFESEHYWVLYSKNFGVYEHSESSQSFARMKQIWLVLVLALLFFCQLVEKRQCCLSVYPVRSWRNQEPRHPHQCKWSLGIQRYQIR